MRDRLARLLASGAIVIAAATFAWVTGPRSVVVHANIYAPLVASAGFLLPPPGGSSPRRTGTVLVNGARFEYSIGRSASSLDAVLSHYERQFEAIDPSGRKISSGVRLRGDGAGVVAGLRISALRQSDGLSNRVKVFAERGRLRDLGEFHVVSAFEQQGTVFIDFTPASDAAVQSLLPQGTTDAPGEDIRGVVRPDGLQRLLTVDHGDSSRTLIYRTRDGRWASGAFRRALENAGWTRNTSLPSDGIAHYSDGTREAFVASTSGDDAALVVVGRMVAHSAKGS